MEVPKENLQEESVEVVRRIHRAKRKSKSRIRDELLVLFKDVETRDMVMSFAPNLAKTNNTDSPASIAMDCPLHLVNIFKSFERHGGHLRRLHGRELKHNIRFDDCNMSLIMQIRLPGEREWFKVDISSVREDNLNEDRQMAALARSRIASCSSISGDSGDDRRVSGFDRASTPIPMEAASSSGANATPLGDGNRPPTLKESDTLLAYRNPKPWGSWKP